MNLNEYFSTKKEIQDCVLQFLDNNQGEEEYYHNLIKLIDNQNFHEDRQEFLLFLRFLSKISKNHNREQNFFETIKKIILYLKPALEKQFSHLNIFLVFKKSKKVLLFLFKEEIIKIGTRIFLKMNSMNYNNFFTPEMKLFVDEKQKEMTSIKAQKNLMSFKFNETLPEDFEIKRNEGENDSFICQLIRDDLIEEFISYVKRNNFPIQSTIEP